MVANVFCYLDTNCEVRFLIGIFIQLPLLFVSIGKGCFKRRASSFFKCVCGSSNGGGQSSEQASSQAADFEFQILANRVPPAAAPRGRTPGTGAPFCEGRRAFGAH